MSKQKWLRVAENVIIINIEHHFITVALICNLSYIMYDSGHIKVTYIKKTTVDVFQIHPENYDSSDELKYFHWFG